MEDIVSRLELVATKLEAIELRASSATTPPIAPLPAPHQTVPTTTTTTAAALYELFLANHLTPLTDAAITLDNNELSHATTVLAEAFTRELTIIKAFIACKRPSDPSQFQTLLQPVADKMIELSTLSSGPRSPYQNHLKLLAEASRSLSWVTYEASNTMGMSPPSQHVEECWSACEFYSNKILMEWKSKDPRHVTWVNSVKGLILGLKDYCHVNFLKGPQQWCTLSGAIDLCNFDPSTTPAHNSTTSVPVKKAGPPRPPPPPPSGFLQQKQQELSNGNKAVQSGTNAMAALFAEINKGDGIAAGLRKVTDDMKTKNKPKEERENTHKNTAATVTQTTTATKVTPPATIAARTPPAARTECEQGRKWVIEHHRNVDTPIVITDADSKQTVYVYDCSNCMIQVTSKTNAITLDACSKVGVVFDSVVSSVEVINCKGVEAQCSNPDGAAPTVAIDKSVGCRLYLPQRVLENTEITTATSSGVNIVCLTDGEGDDSVEHPVPEQFVSRYAHGALVTEPVTHTGA